MVCIPNGLVGFIIGTWNFVKHVRQLSLVRTRGVTTKRIMRHPYGIVGRLIRGTCSTKTDSVLLSLRSTKGGDVVVISGKCNVSIRSTQLDVRGRTADGVDTLSSLTRVAAFKFHKRTLTDVTTIDRVGLIAHRTRRLSTVTLAVHSNTVISRAPTTRGPKAHVRITSLFCGVPTQRGFLGGQRAR